MKVSESPYGMSETYTVKFWYKNEQGFDRQTTEDFYANSRSAHEAVEKFAQHQLSKHYTAARMISVILG